MIRIILIRAKITSFHLDPPSPKHARTLSRSVPLTHHSPLTIHHSPSRLHHLQLRPPVLRSSFLAGIVRYRAGSTKTFGYKPFGSNPLAHQVGDHRFRTVL